MAEATALALEAHLHTVELAGILGARQASIKAPNILRRNLSYVDSGRRALQHRTGQVLHLHLHATSTGGQPGADAAANGHAVAGATQQGSTADPSRPDAGGSTAKDVIIAALCVVVHSSGEEGYVPIAARAMPVPAAAKEASLAVQLPLGGSPRAAGLAVVLIHQRSTRLALLVSMACQRCRRRAGGSSSSSGGGTAAAGSGCKVVSPSVTAAAAFQLVPSGSAVAYSIVHLGDPLRAGSGGGKQQGPLTKLDGVLTTHEPAAASDSSAAPPPISFPWIQFGPGPQRGENGSRSSGSAGGSTRPSDGASSSSIRTQFWYGISVGSAAGSGRSRQGEVDERGREQREAVGPGAAVAGTKRKAGVLAGEQHQNGRASQAALPAAEAQASQQQGAQPPPPSQQQQQQQQQQQLEPLLTFFFTSFDGGRTACAQLRGFRCPLSSCRGLRCHSYAALQQHLQACHSYQSCYFSDALPGGDLEVYLRCKPAWRDAQGGFLPRQLAPATLESHPLGTLLSRTHILRPLMYHCPRAQRSLRLGQGGRYPRDEEEELAEAEAEAAAGLLAQEGPAPGEAPSSSAPLSSSLGPTATTAGGSGASTELAAAARHAGGGRAAAAAAARRLRVGGRGRGRKGAAPVRRQGHGLEMLTQDGRPKFYHSRTCVAMTRQELFGSGDCLAESEDDLLEWQRDCRQRLQEQAGLCAEEREFMFQWNLFVHKHPLHADADLPAAVQQFAAQQAARLAGDGPFRRCLLSYLLNLWRFRLLTPQQLHELTRSLPPVA